MLVYIVRRLIAAVFLLLIVTAATFAIFFVLPRLAGATAETSRRATSARAADAATIHAHRGEARASPTPCTVQYGRFLAGSVRRRATTAPARPPCTARRPASGYSFINQNPVLPDLLDRLPVTLSLAAGAAVLWLVGGVDRRRALGAAPRQRVRPGGDGRRARRRLAADLLHRPAVACRSSATGWGSPRPAAATRRSRTTRCCGPTTCCCRGSRWRSSTRPGTPG